MTTKLSFLLCLLAVSAFGQSSLTPRYGQVVGATNCATSAAIVTTNTVTPYRGRGLLVFVYGAAGAAVTNSAALTFSPTYDGTNYTTDPTLVCPMPVSTNAVRWATNLPPTALDHARAWRVGVTNWSGATYYVSNVTWCALP